MLVCSISQRAKRAAIAAGIVEPAIAADTLGSGNVIFATLVDDPASVREVVDAYLGQIMVEAANATATVNAGLSLSAAVLEAASAATVINATLGYGAAMLEPATAIDTPSAAVQSNLYGFDPATTLNVTLSNSNLTAAHANATTNSGVRGIAPKSAGKYYCEYRVDVFGSDKLGLITAAGSYATSAAFASVVMSNGNANVFGTTSPNIGSFVVGNVLCVAVDFDAGLMWFRKNANNWNNSGTANPATGVGGTAFTAHLSAMPAIGFSGAAGATFTANFGATAYGFTKPSGFSDWTI
jgi:hypothetical protein